MSLILVLFPHLFRKFPLFIGSSQVHGHELGQTSGDGEGQRGLACCSPCSHKESDMAGQLYNKNHVHIESSEKADSYKTTKAWLRLPL